MTMHWTELWLNFYDARLDANVPYAKHAISLDENRKDFARVSWGTKGDVWDKDKFGNRRFEQVWFAGNHADVGGGYPENESRLSDTALQWMVQSAAVVPDGLVTDPNVLNLWPCPKGIQHDEVKAGYGLIANKLGITWTRQDRELPIPKGATTSEAIIHRSVYERFDMKEVQLFDSLGPYRPPALRTHVDFARFYATNATFPATSEKDATRVAGNPINPQPHDAHLNASATSRLSGA